MMQEKAESAARQGRLAAIRRLREKKQSKLTEQSSKTDFDV